MTTTPDPATPDERAGHGYWRPAGPLAALGDGALGDGDPIHVDVAGFPLCLARSRGQVYALLDVCSHGQVALSDGDVEDGYIECWLHGSRFSLETGDPTGPPATEPVPVYPVRIIDDRFEVNLPVGPPPG